MNILETILSSQNGAAVAEISKSLGPGQSETQSALGKLLPAVARGFSNNASRQDGLGALLGALGKGGHQRYIDNPASIADQSSIGDGNGILGHIFGRKDVSRNGVGQNYVTAYMWYSLVAEVFPGEEKNKERLKAMMTTDQITEAELRAKHSKMFSTSATPITHPHN